MARRYDVHMPPAARLSALPRSVTIVSLAYTHHTVLSILSWPLIAIALLPIAVGRALFLSADGTGTVVIHRKNRLPVVTVISGLLIAGLSLLLMLAMTSLGWPTAVTCIVGVIWIPVSGAAFLAPQLKARRRTYKLSMRLPGDGGRAYYVGFLAQMPGSTTSALSLARRLIETLEPGSTVHIEAADGLVAKYRALGFVQS